MYLDAVVSECLRGERVYRIGESTPIIKVHGAPVAAFEPKGILLLRRYCQSRSQHTGWSRTISNASARCSSIFNSPASVTCPYSTQVVKVNITLLSRSTDRHGWTSTNTFSAAGRTMRRCSYGHYAERDVRYFVSLYRTVLAADAVVPMLSGDEHQRIRSNVDCLGVFSRSGTGTQCPPLLAYRLPTLSNR